MVRIGEVYVSWKEFCHPKGFCLKQTWWISSTIQDGSPFCHMAKDTGHCGEKFSDRWDETSPYLSLFHSLRQWNMAMENHFSLWFSPRRPPFLGDVPRCGRCASPGRPHGFPVKRPKRWGMGMGSHSSKQTWRNMDGVYTGSLVGAWNTGPSKWTTRWDAPHGWHRLNHIVQM